MEVESGEASQRGAPMDMTVDDYECAQNLSHEVCGVIIKCGTKMRAQAQCMYATRPSRSTSSVVLCSVSCMLFASFHFVVCDDAAVRRTLVQIAFTVAIVFIVAILRRICCLGGIVFTRSSPSHLKSSRNRVRWNTSPDSPSPTPSAV